MKNETKYTFKDGSYIIVKQNFARIGEWSVSGRTKGGLLNGAGRGETRVSAYQNWRKSIEPKTSTEDIFDLERTAEVFSAIDEELGKVDQDDMNHYQAQKPAETVTVKTYDWDADQHYTERMSKEEYERNHRGAQNEIPTSPQPLKIQIGMKVDVESYEVYKTLWAGAVHNPGYTFNTEPIFNGIVTGIFEEDEVEILKNGDYCYVPLAACKPTGHRLTTQEVADVLHISRRAVLKACELGTMKADKIGRDWLIATDALTDYQKTYLRRPGRK